MASVILKHTAQQVDDSVDWTKEHGDDVLAMGTDIKTLQETKVDDVEEYEEGAQYVRQDGRWVRAKLGITIE